MQYVNVIFIIICNLPTICMSQKNKLTVWLSVLMQGANGPADATATSLKSRMVHLSGAGLSRLPARKRGR